LNDNKNNGNNTEKQIPAQTRVFGANSFGLEPLDKEHADAAAIDPAELARRFDALEEEFRRAHSPQQAHPKADASQTAGRQAQQAPQTTPASATPPSSQQMKPATSAIQQPSASPFYQTQSPAQAQQASPFFQAQRQSEVVVSQAQQQQVKPPGQIQSQQPPKQPSEQSAKQQPEQQQVQSPPSGRPQSEAQPPGAAPKTSVFDSSDEIPLTLDAIFADEDAEKRKDRSNSNNNGESDSADQDERPRRRRKGETMTGTSNSSRRRKKRQKKQSLVAKIAKGFLSAILILVIAVGVIGGVYVYGVVKDMPRYSTEDLNASLKVMSTIYDDQGQPLKNIYLPGGQRTLVTYDQLPEDLVNALVAIEDKTFWTHKGFNVTRIVGAVLESVKSGGGITGASGTSTLTQQLARNIWIVDEKSDRTLTRKIKEAFYAREIEKNLSKEEILSSYLNIIEFGNHSYGIGAAAENYYGKKVEDLDLIESAALAALPKGPSEYAMITTVTPDSVSTDDPRILLAGTQYTYLYSDAIVPRLHLVLSEMLAQGYITQQEYDAALADDIRLHLHPKELEVDSNADFFVSYAIDQIADDLMKNDPDITSRDEAMQRVYSGGLDIYTTFNQRAQEIATEEFNNPENFPKVQPWDSDRDKNKNIIGDNGNILVFNYDYMFETREDGPWSHLAGNRDTFPQNWHATINEDDYKALREEKDYIFLDNGNMVIFAGASEKFGVYRTEGAGGPDINLEFKDFYVIRDDVYYIAKGGIINIPTEYKGMDEKGNLILSKQFFESEHNIFTSDENGEIWIGPSHFTLRQEVIQPQTSFVLIDHTTGQLKAMIGGRGIKGQFQFNRALSPQPPGSTMKPIGVYAPALEMSANEEQVGGDIPTYGTYWSPLSIIIDEEMEYQGRKWPRNWDNNFRGPQTMRYSIENSMNVNAVKVQLAIGNQRSVNFLKKLGISTLVEEGGTNDLAPGALALGGMTKGLTTLENASAYGTFANAGERITPITYTQVKNKRGDVLLDGTPEKTQAMDPGVAFIMNDMLRTTITNGIAGAASVKGTQIAGKTGTTSDFFDAWFVGNTPKYSAAVWIGCDVDVRLSQGSAAASKMFSKVMTRIIEGEEQGEYPAAPENVIQATVSTKPTNNPANQKTYTDYFLAGTVPEFLDLGVEEVEVCSNSGYLATEWCPNREMKQFSTLTDIDAEGMETPHAPEHYCYLHNLNTELYPIAPGMHPHTQVPNLSGMTLEQAQATLGSANLIFGESFPEFSATVPEGQVFSQNPTPGEWLPQGFKVNVTISKGANPNITLPNLVGSSESDATTMLSGMGLNVDVKRRESEGPPGIVLEQNPPQGSQVTRGSQVTITVSRAD
jgi:penicillin-binding protein 1A